MGRAFPKMPSCSSQEYAEPADDGFVIKIWGGALPSAPSTAQRFVLKHRAPLCQWNGLVELGSVCYCQAVGFSRLTIDDELERRWRRIYYRPDNP